MASYTKYTFSDGQDMRFHLKNYIYILIAKRRPRSSIETMQKEDPSVNDKSGSIGSALAPN